MTPTKEVLMEIDIFNRADKIKDEFYGKVLEIIHKVENQWADEILSVGAGHDTIHVYYSYTCHGIVDKDTFEFPSFWLNEGFDYTSDAQRNRDVRNNRLQTHLCNTLIM